jgi:hypothetical protein
LVRSIAFGLARPGSYEEEEDDEKTTPDKSPSLIQPEDAVCTFLRLCPSATSGHILLYNWTPRSCNAVIEHAAGHLTDLTLQHADWTTLTRLSTIPNLRSLCIHRLEDSQTQNTLLPPLLSLSIHHGPSALLQLLLNASLASLVDISISLNALPILFQQQHTSLSFLTVWTSGDPEDVKLITQKEKFWLNFSRSKLRVVTFKGRSPSLQIEEALFGPYGSILEFTPPSLQRLEFLSWIPYSQLIHRLRRSSTIKELGIMLLHPLSDSDYFYKALQLLCYGEDINLLLLTKVSCPLLCCSHLHSLIIFFIAYFWQLRM